MVRPLFESAYHMCKWIYKSKAAFDARAEQRFVSITIIISTPLTYDTIFLSYDGNLIKAYENVLVQILWTQKSVECWAGIFEIFIILSGLDILKIR